MTHFDAEKSLGAVALRFSRFDLDYISLSNCKKCWSRILERPPRTQQFTLDKSSSVPLLRRFSWIYQSHCVEKTHLIEKITTYYVVRTVLFGGPVNASLCTNVILQLKA